MLNENENDDQVRKDEPRQELGAGNIMSLDEFTRMREWIEQSRIDSDRARAVAEQNRADIEDLNYELADHSRKTRRSGWIAAVLAIGLIGAFAYGYHHLRHNDELLTQYPLMATTLKAVDERIGAAEGKLRSWTSDWDGLSSRIGNIESGVHSSLKQTRDFAQEQAAKVQHQLQDEMDNRTRTLDAKLNNLEQSTQEDQTQIAGLKEDLATVQKDTEEQVAGAQEQTARDMGTLRAEVVRNREEFDSMARNAERRRLEFEISRDQSRDIAPGITLTVSNMNVEYQRVAGRILVVPDGRILWIRDQGVQQPVAFYCHKDERAYEVVFTRVNRDSALGYVVMPAFPAEKAAAVSQGSLSGAGELAAGSIPARTAVQ